MSLIKKQRVGVSERESSWFYASAGSPVLNNYNRVCCLISIHRAYKGLQAINMTKSND